jgi:hypothetical protein
MDWLLLDGQRAVETDYYSTHNYGFRESYAATSMEAASPATRTIALWKIKPLSVQVTTHILKCAQ